MVITKRVSADDFYETTVSYIRHDSKRPSPRRITTAHTGTVSVGRPCVWDRLGSTKTVDTKRSGKVSKVTYKEGFTVNSTRDGGSEDDRDHGPCGRKGGLSGTIGPQVQTKGRLRVPSVRISVTSLTTLVPRRFRNPELSVFYANDDTDKSPFF